jgi:Cu/Ag efflux pump CusA
LAGEPIQYPGYPSTPFRISPIEVAVANIPDIVELRSISRLGLSVVTVVFEDNVDIYWARQQLTERLKEAEEVIPEGVAQISLAPISTGLGEIYQYRLAVEKGYEKRFDPMEFRIGWYVVKCSELLVLPISTVTADMSSNMR